MSDEYTANGDTTGGASPSQSARTRRRHGHLFAEQRLKRLFNNIVDQPIPEELLDLLRRIDARLPQA